MDIGLLVTFAGILVAGLAGVLGVWMERDRSAPTLWAWVFSSFILVAMGVEGVHAVKQAAEDGETEEAMARVLERLSDLAANGDNPALSQFVGAELAAQARSNPDVVSRLEKNVAAKGGDPTAVRKKAAAAARSAAGLPPRPPAALAAAKAAKAGKAGKARGDGTARQKAPGEGKTGKASGGASAVEGKVGKASGGGSAAGEPGKAGKAAVDVAADALGKTGKADGKAKAPEKEVDKAIQALDPAKAKADPTKAKVDPGKLPKL